MAPAKNHSNPEQTHTLFIPTTYIYFVLFPGFCLQWKDLTFTPSSPACAAARCCPRHFSSIAQACYCSEISPRGRRSAGETQHTWNKPAVLLHFGAYRCVLDCFNRRGGSFHCVVFFFRTLLVLWDWKWDGERERDKASQDVDFLHFDSCSAAWRQNKSTWNQLYFTVHAPPVRCSFYFMVLRELKTLFTLMLTDNVSPPACLKSCCRWENWIQIRTCCTNCSFT